MKIGFGYDAHRIIENGKLILGGFEIPCGFGLLGHSDADVLTHAIMDSVLGALGKPDIGEFFPDTDDEYKEIDSTIMLSKVAKLLYDEGCEIINIDTTIVAEKPRLSSFVNDIKKEIMMVLNLRDPQLGVKFKTTEGLGFNGRCEGISAYSVVLIDKYFDTTGLADIF